MKQITLADKTHIANHLLRKIRALHKEGEIVRFMEVCGTHTVAIFREGIRQLLPKGIELVSGPGCPVCVTDQAYIDKALAYADDENTIIATFGDMLKVPGTHGNLWDKKEQGASIHIIYSPMEIIELGKKYPHKRIVFLAIGFETTIAVIAATVKAVEMAKLENVFFLVSHKLVPPALVALLGNEDNQIDGFILPGHVSVVIGEEPYQFLGNVHHVPSCIAGFDGLDILEAIHNLLDQRANGESYVGNVYKSVVAKKGNPVAMKLIDELYEPCHDSWRGIGVIPDSGLQLKGAYKKYDVEVQFPLTLGESSKNPKGCQCDKVIQGILRPDECSLFGRACTADHPIGACMVSVEGSCSAWYKYGQASGSMDWEE